MTGAKTPGGMSPGLLRVKERARRDPHERQFSLAYLIDVDALKRAYGRIRKNTAAGVDGVPKEQYGQDLEKNLTDLHERLRSMKARSRGRSYRRCWAMFICTTCWTRGSKNR